MAWSELPERSVAAPVLAFAHSKKAILADGLLA